MVQGSLQTLYWKVAFWSRWTMIFFLNTLKVLMDWLVFWSLLLQINELFNISIQGTIVFGFGAPQSNHNVHFVSHGTSYCPYCDYHIYLIVDKMKFSICISWCFKLGWVECPMVKIETLYKNDKNVWIVDFVTNYVLYTN